MESEQHLLERIRAGQREAQRDLYCRFSAMAMAVCMRYVANQETARDVMHDSFVKILSAVGRFEFRGEGSLRAWVARVVANESLSYLRDAARLTFADELPPDDPPDEEPDVGTLPPGLLQRMIERLPDGYRAVLNLYVFEQLPHREIARRLGIKESTSASQFLRAKRLLAKQIREYLNNERE